MAATKESSSNSSNPSVAANQAAITEAATAAAHKAIEAMADKARVAETATRQTASESSEALAERRKQLQAQAQLMSENAQGFVQKHPLASAGIAFAAGALIASCFSNKK